MSEAFILDCPNYAAYLDHYINNNTDMRYLRNSPVARMLLQLNYRPNVRIYTKQEYLHRKKQLYQQFAPHKIRTALFSRGLRSNDPFLVELAAREKLNKQKVLSTIIHLFHLNKDGFETSGFIDFADSLHRANTTLVKDCVDWVAVFERRILLRPTRSDLSYFDWHKLRVNFSNTENYAVEHDVNGLIFVHRGDHKKFYVDKAEKMKANGYTQQILHSNLYGYVILYDHIIRKKI